MHYVAFIHSDGEDGVGISFPDFPGCVSVGDTHADAIAQGAAALAFHVEGMVEDGEPIPPPRSLADIQGDPALLDWRQGADFDSVPDVASFVQGLAGTPGSSLFNPWFQSDGNDASADAPNVRRRQLVDYLTSRVGRANYLLIAEAPGYRGAHFTGIAMTSERVLLGHHPEVQCSSLILPGLQPVQTSRKRLRPQGFSEPTATVIWKTLLELRVNPLDVVLWNAVPWHPFRRDKGCLSNRTPTQEERGASLCHLRKFLDLFPKARPVAIGKVSDKLLSKCGRTAPCVRHPANGGAKQFRKEIAQVLQER